MARSYDSKNKNNRRILWVEIPALKIKTIDNNSKNKHDDKYRSLG